MSWSSWISGWGGGGEEPEGTWKTPPKSAAPTADGDKVDFAELVMQPGGGGGFSDAGGAAAAGGAPAGAGGLTDFTSLAMGAGTERPMVDPPFGDQPAAGSERLPDGKGVATALTEGDVESTARFLNSSLPALWAVISVETKGAGYWNNRLPAILFERHYFRRFTDGRYDATHPNISQSKWGGYGKSSEQYDRLALAASLDYDAALKSASWGLGQVMGANSDGLDYPNIRDFVAKMRDSEGAQLDAMARFIDDRGLARSMRNRDWASFARKYNGPDYAKNRYDVQLAEAFARYSDPSRLPDWRVRSAQLYLAYLGYLDVSGVDGVIGRKTRSGLERFYHDMGETGFEADGLSTVTEAMVSALEARTAALPDPWPLGPPQSRAGMV